AEHLRCELGRLNVPPDIERAVSALRRRAGLIGEVLDARLYGRWTNEEATTLAGRLDSSSSEAYGCPVQLRFSPPQGRSDLDPLVNDLQELLESSNPPHTWIMVARHPAIADVALAARARGARTVLWAADADDVSPDLRSRVDHFVALQAVLDLRPHTV